MHMKFRKGKLVVETELWLLEQKAEGGAQLEKHRKKFKLM